jgi:tetratricopeptide (TPR) repeat protein
MSSSRILLFVGAGIIFLVILISSVIKAGHSVGERLTNIQVAEQKKKDSLQHIQDSLSAYLTLSDSLIQKHKYDSAIRICDIVIGIDNTTAKAYLYKGIIYRQEKKFGLALDSYSSAIRLNESTGQAWFDRALCYLKQKKKKDAINDVKHALNFNYHGADS